MGREILSTAYEKRRLKSVAHGDLDLGEEPVGCVLERLGWVMPRLAWREAHEAEKVCGVAAIGELAGGVMLKPIGKPAK